MAKIYLKAKYTPEALKGFLSSPSDDRKQAVNKLVDSIGGNVLSFDIVRGPYDIIISVEVSNFAAVAGAKIAVQSSGMVSDAVILEAIDMTEIVTQASTALGNYTKPGA